MLGKYLTPDLPFPPEALAPPPAAQETLGRAAAIPDLAGCLSAAVERFASATPDVQAAIFLTDLYACDRPQARTLSLRAAAGFAPTTQKTVTDSWATPDSIAWQAIRSTQSILHQPDTAAGDDARAISAWPIVSPHNAGLAWGALVIGHDVQPLPEATANHAAALAAALADSLAVRRTVKDTLSNKMLDLLFHPTSRVVVSELAERKQARQQKARDLLTAEKPLPRDHYGAMLASIVSRAKRAAVKREMERATDLPRGINWSDLYAAVRTECVESKNQYIYELNGDDPYGRGAAYRDTEQYHVEVILPPEHDVPPEWVWLTHKAFAWRDAANASQRTA